ncbi:MAG TPA: S9 family peptidase [Bryobacteraceae bacterium]|nr:S9 family peptidase [Bryobacteraceae bacterium]
MALALSFRFTSSAPARYHGAIVAMRFLVCFLLLALGAPAQQLTLDRLFRRPFLWGTSPEQVTWSKEGHTLAFLWNTSGRRFLDLYAYHPGSRKLTRLTDLEPVKDDLNLTEEEKDDRQKSYLEPLAGLGSFELSRDSSHAAFSYRGDLYVVETQGEKPPFRLTRTKASESSPQLSPDNTRISFLRDRQLFVQDLRDGRLWQVTDIEEPDQAITSYRWSPDGTRFVVAVRKGRGRQMVLPNYSGRFVKAGSFSRSVAGDEPVETALSIVPVEGGKPLPVDLGPLGAKVYLGLVDWSPDSSQLLVRSVHPKVKQAHLLVIDAKTGKSVVLQEETDSKWVHWTSAAWSPDSRNVVFTSDREGWAQLYRIPATGGKPEQLTRGAWEAQDPQWAGENIYYTSTEGGAAERHFYRIRPDGSGKQKLSRREGLNYGLVSEDGMHVAWLQANLSNPSDLYVDEDRVTTSPLPEFANYRWPESRFFQYPSRRDGKSVAARLMLPPGYRQDDKSGKRWPAVVYIHGSGYATSVLKEWGSYDPYRFAFNTYLAQRGFVVLEPDYRGSSGYGRDWRTDVHLHMGGPDLDDVLGGLDYLRGLGDIDMKRIGIWGVSYGGFMTNMAMFLATDEFRAGVSWAGVNDWENYNAWYTSERLTTPEENPEAFRRSSPIHFSRLLKNPLLIVHGMVDDNVLFQDAVQLTEKLVQEGRPFWHIYYPQEDHAFVRDETLVDAYSRSAEWFERHLR